MKNIAVIASLPAVVVIASAQTTGRVVPIIADFEVSAENSAPGTTGLGNVTTGRFYRDSHGRTRLDLDKTVTITDPASRTLTVLNPEIQKAKKMSLPSAGRIATSASVTQEFLGEPKDLDIRSIEGHEVKGREYKWTLPAGTFGNKVPVQRTVRSWTSESLQLTLQTTIQDEASGTVTQQFRNIVVFEPDPNLFEIPAQFAVEIGGPTVGSGQ